MEHLSVSAILLLIISATITEAQDEPVALTSTLDGYNAACPGEVVVFTCKALGTLVMWTSPTLIGIGQESIQFSSALHEIGLGMVQSLPSGRDTFAQLIYKDNTTITTELRVVIPEDAVHSDSLLVTCTREDLPRHSNMSNSRAAGMIVPPRINNPILLYHDPITRHSFYNISWNPPENAVLIDIERYEIYVGSFKQSTSDTYKVVELTLSDDVVAINVTVSVIDRCNRRQSTPIPFRFTVPDTPPVPGLAYGFIATGFLLCLITFFFFTLLRMTLFRFTEQLNQEPRPSPILKTFMWSGFAVSAVFFIASLILLITTTYQQTRSSSFELNLIFPSLLLPIILVIIEWVGMMVLGVIMYTRYEQAIAAAN